MGYHKTPLTPLVVQPVPLSRSSTFEAPSSSAAPDAVAIVNRSELPVSARNDTAVTLVEQASTPVVFETSMALLYPRSKKTPKVVVKAEPLMVQVDYEPKGDAKELHEVLEHCAECSRKLYFITWVISPLAMVTYLQFLELPCRDDKEMEPIRRFIKRIALLIFDFAAVVAEEAEELSESIRIAEEARARPVPTDATHVWSARTKTEMAWEDFIAGPIARFDSDVSTRSFFLHGKF